MEITVRPRPQPALDGSVFWNPNGYEWTGVFKTEVTRALMATTEEVG